VPLPLKPVSARSASGLGRRAPKVGGHQGEHLGELSGFNMVLTCSKKNGDLRMINGVFKHEK
jgi:hypothetical protein